MKDNSKADVSHTDEFDKMFQEMVKQVEYDYKVKSEHPETEEEAKPKYEDEKNGESKVNGEYYSTPKYLVRPSGYQFKDENGNVINATKIVLEKKKKEYPKTYEECCKVLSLGEDGRLYTKGYKASLIQNFQKLIICRAAYWKIAGEEMGLGKPWEPDWNTSEPKYVIAYTSRGIEKQWETTYCKSFAFPTPEMRDAFKENFDPDIEFCKELL